MTLNILADTTRIQVIAGFESGHTMVFVQADPGASFEKLYCAQPHRQPGEPLNKPTETGLLTPIFKVLSLAISPCKDHYITSSADANIVKHPLPSERSIFKTVFKPLKISATKHSGQQGLSYRSDGRIFATAGWDSAMRIYSGKTLKEVAVLKWHREGCYATAFAAVETAPKCSKEQYSPVNDTKSEDVSKIIVAEPLMSSVQEMRDDLARATHWLATGSKDGKISLWDIY